MRKQIVFITIFLTIAVSWLWPNFGYAFFAEPFTAFASSFIKIGSTLDDAVGSMRQVASATITNTQETAAKAGQAITKHYSITKSQITNAIERQHQTLRQAKNHLMSTGHQMLRLSAKALLDRQASFMATAEKSVATARLAVEQGKHLVWERLPKLMLGATDAIKNTALSLMNQESGIKNHANDQKSMIHDSSFMLQDQSASEQEKTSDGSSLPRLAERIIERIIMKESNQESGIMNQGNNDNGNNKSMIHDSNFMIQDPRINSLITNVADLTSRIDEKDGSPYRNSALFNMISQSQRIKTLDDVKITNATIEGYVTGTTLANYLPLGGAHSPED